MRPTAFPAGEAGSGGSEGSPPPAEQRRHHGAMTLCHCRIKNFSLYKQTSFFVESDLSQDYDSLTPMAEPDAAATWSGPSGVPASATEP